VIAEWLDVSVPAVAAAIDAVVEAFPHGGITAAAAATGRAELLARLEKLGVKMTDNVAAALSGDRTAISG
jgi:hypothetical protein